MYRLYSSAVFESFFAAHADPEIMRMPIEGVTLTMKAMSIDAVVNFPFPNPPGKDKLQKAENVLKNLGALDKSGHITDLGKAMSLFPLSPRYAKVLVMGRQHGCLPYIIAIVAGLSIGDPFLAEDSLFGHEGPHDDEADEPGEAKPPESEERRTIRKAFFASKEVMSPLDVLLSAHSRLDA